MAPVTNMRYDLNFTMNFTINTLTDIRNISTLQVVHGLLLVCLWLHLTDAFTPRFVSCPKFVSE